MKLYMVKQDKLRVDRKTKDVVMRMLTGKQIEETILGLAVGDALGVPVEGHGRADLAERPVRDMLGYGTHSQPPGTWSDDTSLTLATMESIGRTDTVDFDSLMQNFCHWALEGAYTPAGHAFGIGSTTDAALHHYRQRTPALQAGGIAEQNNGNGSLVRMVPIALYIYAHHGTSFPSSDLSLIHNVSALTHRHARAKMACTFFVLVALQLLDGATPMTAVREAGQRFRDIYWQRSGYEHERWQFERLLDVQAFRDLPEADIHSSGYVIDTLETACWCLLRAENYRACVLTAVNLGGKTASSGAMAGALAAIQYGYDAIPQPWLAALVRREYIEDMCEAFGRNLTR